MTTKDGGYTCDCSGLDFYGKNCEKPYWGEYFASWFHPKSDTVHFILTHFKWFWSFINLFDSARNFIMGRVVIKRASFIDMPPKYNSDYEYVTTEAYFNLSQYARTLPPVPRDCPTPLGTAGSATLPDAKMLVKKFFTRKKFIPEPTGTNVLFGYFAQFFTHQFFKTDFEKGAAHQWGNHGVDCSSIYGRNKSEELKLRTMKGGKMKTQVVNGDVWPPSVKDAPVEMAYLSDSPGDGAFAVGHRFYSILPGLVIWSTIFLREHNNICDQLVKEHPDWSDEQVFQTARNAVTAILIKIVIEDYVQHISGYHFKLVYNPEIVFGKPLQYQNRISLEFNHAYHWHPLIPSELTVDGTTYQTKDTLWKPEILLNHSFKNFVEAMVKSPAGRVGPRNHGPSTTHVMLMTIEHGRELRMQSFNNYRERFGEKGYTSFEELVGEDQKELAKELSEVYGGDINAVEFAVGMFVEKHRSLVMFGESMTSIAAPYSVFGLYANPISSPQFWKPSTFGGDKMFERVKTMNVQRLFCENMKEGDCPRVAYEVPDDVHETYKNNRVEL